MSLVFSSSFLSCELKVNPVWNPARACCFVFVVLWILYHFELNQLIQRLSFLCGFLSNGMLFQRLVKGSILCKENHLSFMILKLLYVHLFNANYGNSGRDQGSLELWVQLRHPTSMNKTPQPGIQNVLACVLTYLTHMQRRKGLILLNYNS